MAETAMKYYRTKLLGLNVVVGDPKADEGEVAPQFVTFSAYKEKLINGEEVKYGLLATDNAVAIDKLKDDANVEEIQKSEYESLTDPKNTKVTPATT